MPMHNALNIYSFNLNHVFSKLDSIFILVHYNNTLLWGIKMSVVFLFLFKKNYKNDLSNCKSFLHLAQIKSGPEIKCLGWGFL